MQPKLMRYDASIGAEALNQPLTPSVNAPQKKYIIPFSGHTFRKAPN